MVLHMASDMNRDFDFLPVEEVFLGPTLFGRTLITLYSHIVNSSFCAIQARSDSDREWTTPREARLGTIGKNALSMVVT